MDFVKDLDTPLLRLSPRDVMTLRGAASGVHIFGGIGSGKTSGSGSALAGAYLRAGFGGVVTCVKPEDVSLWQGYAAQHGRERSLVLLDEREGFNFLGYEMARYGLDGIGTVTETIMTIIEAAKKASGTASQKGGEAFWEDSTRGILRYTLPPLYAASGSLSVGDIIRFITTAPTSQKDVTNADWQRGSFMYSVMDAATRCPQVPMAPGSMQHCVTFWANEFSAVPDKTRGNQIATITSALDRFRHGRLNKVFCGKTTILPEMTFAGAVILLAMPTLTWGADGIIAQQLFKYAWQRAVLNRNSLAEKHRERPLYIWADESQETVNSFDFEFQSVCRSAKACVVYLTQSLPNYYAKMGGDSPRDSAHALVGKFNTHVYHANACPETNEYASRMIGKVMKRRRNYSAGTSRSTSHGRSMGSNESRGSSYTSGTSYSSSDKGGDSASFSSSNSETHSTGSNFGWNRSQSFSDSESEGYSESMEYVIEPGEFARGLKTGGPQNGNEVTAVWFQAGRVFEESGSNVLLARFRQ